MKNKIAWLSSHAFRVLRHNMQYKSYEPDSMAQSWHDNLAMMCYDAIRAYVPVCSHEVARKIGNDAASRFMKLCFDVTTKRT